MEIVWHGLSFLEIKGKEDGWKRTIAINPFDKNINLKPLKIKADIVVSSSSLLDSLNKRIIKNIASDRRSDSKTAIVKPFLIDGPGEYEIKGIKIKGTSVPYIKSKGKKEHRNTIFKIELEKIKICYLDNFNEGQIPSSVLESIMGIDILIISIGGNLTISGQEAAKIVNQVEPKIVIPMNYLPSDFKDSPMAKMIKRLGLNLENEKNFLKNLGVKRKEKIKKLKVKTSDFQRNGTEPTLLEMI